MSKYSGRYDFKDFIDANFKDLNDFLVSVKGILYQWDDNDQLTMCSINKPIDVVKYYQCSVENVSYDKDSYVIYLSRPTRIQKWLTLHTQNDGKLNEEDITKLVDVYEILGYNKNDLKLVGPYM